MHALDGHSQQCFRKLINGAKRAVSARDLLFEENFDLRKQNNESNTRVSTKSTVLEREKS